MSKNLNLPKNNHYETPAKFYAELHAEFNFDFDPCPFHHDLNKWDGLEIEWGQRNYINPPYDRKLKPAFVKKALVESRKGKLCVLLLPVHTSSKLFKKVIEPNVTEPIRYVEGRLSFKGINTKGQYVNYPKKEQTKETIIVGYNEYRDQYITIPKYINQKGQQDSMIVIFDGRKANTVTRSQFDKELKELLDLDGVSYGEILGKIKQLKNGR